MTYEDIAYFAPINTVDNDKVDEIAKSIEQNGWIGCPILVYGESLLTGSHRLTALKKLYNSDADILDMDVAEDVTDIVEAKLQAAEEELGYIPDIEYDNIGWLLEGSWVEKYKDEISEW